MTITDPRHPLYGRTFPLLEVRQANRQHVQCVIELDAAIHRVIPLEVTDLGEDPRLISPLPLDILCVRQLLVVCQQLTHRNAEVSHHATSDAPTDRNTQPSQLYHPTQTLSDLDTTDPTTTGCLAPGTPTCLSVTPHPSSSHDGAGK